MLTRLLYLVDHVKQNIVHCILLDEKEELCYWLAEYYYSGFHENSMEWLTQIYYQYYALTYPSFEKYIHKKRMLYSISNDYSILVYVANNLRIKRHSTYYEQAKNKPLQVNRGRKPNWLTKYDDTIKQFIYLISKQDWGRVYKEIQHSDRDKLRDMYESICLYRNNHQPIDSEIMSYYKCIAGNYSTETIKQMLFATCLHLQEQYSIETQYGTWLTNKKRLHIYTNLQVTNRPYETLKVNVKYKTRQSIPQQELCSIVHNWIEYTYETPLWRERIDRYGGKVENNRVVFSKDEDLENFYENYGYELDEQSNDMYEKLYSVSFIK
jgi:hypothetical protein